jgi:alpha-galactosidase
MDFILELDYVANNVEHKLFVDSASSNEHFKLNVESSENKILINLIPIDDIQIRSAELKIKHSYKSSDCLFGNGYQSWSHAFEYNTNGYVHGLNHLPKFINKKYSFDSYGDYRFYNYESTSGIIRSNNYTFIRKMDEIELFGSLNEKVGYTMFEHNTPISMLKVYRDFEGVVFSDSFELFNVIRIVGNEDDVFDEYFRMLKIQKPTSKKMLGYTSWYNHYQNISETIILDNLAAFKDNPKKFDVFQIDDGFETFVGDWFDIDTKKFPYGLKPIVDKIHKDKMLAGIWLAPFAMEEDSDLFRAHPDWAIRDDKGNLIKAGSNWSGFYGLDFSNAEVKDYISNVLDYYQNELGFDLFKLDFLYAVNFLPYNNKSRATIMYEAMEFLRNKLKDKLILGCGVNLFTAAGLVDYCRVSCDVSLDFDDKFFMSLVHQERVSTKNAIMDTIYRNHLNNRAFLSDPDVFLLRDNNINLSEDQKEALLTINSIFGSVLFTSDNIKDYSNSKLELLEKAINMNAKDIKVRTENEVITIKYVQNDENKVIKYDSNAGRLI